MSLLSYVVTKIIDYIKVLPLYCLPQHGLTAIVYRLTRIEHKAWKNFVIRTFVKLYKVDMNQAIWPSEEDYSSFNAFFIRNLKPDARSWKRNKNNILSPVDGAVSQIGYIYKNKLIQAKGIDYSLERLLANDEYAVERFQDGNFITLYLSPRDYHRIHMPVSGKLIKTIFVPGNLFPVNTSSVRTVDQLFARNERFISLFETELGLVAQIMVGATFVGSMETVFAGQITPTKHRQISIKEYEETPITLNQAEEFGHFNMGSTVILLFEKNKIIWSEDLKENDPIQVGNLIATVSN
ncbi:MAG TPA: phosphatidylserine decarboxylase [Thiotrichaceae bacterium]|jgi:phosphatidylserine decarboxylase|nr:phosphatidylserine decarboxylase [Thiotrichaceae bacterium]HIM07826.1 phosphatidylserine decarboxylase [Gammaproteobacteria bacterium]